MTIREFAKQNGHEVVGNLTRKPWRGSDHKFYIDEAGNEYWIGKHGISIVSADGNWII